MNVKENVLGPPKELWQALRWAYLPLLLSYFAHSFSGMFGMGAGLLSVPGSFWLYEELLLTTAQVEWAMFTISLPWISKILVGQIIDRIKVKWRKRLVFLAGIIMASGFFVLASLAGGYEWTKVFMEWFGYDYSLGLSSSLPQDIFEIQKSALQQYQFAIYIVGFLLISSSMVLQDVIFDPMSRHIVSKFDEKGNKLGEEAYMRKVGLVQTWCRISFNLASIVGMISAFVLMSFKFSMESIFLVCMIVPVFTMTFIQFVRLPSKVETTPIKARIIVLAFMIIITAVVTQIMNIPFSRELSFLVTFGVVVSLLVILYKRDSSSDNKKRALLFTMFTMFFVRFAPGAGSGVTWWHREVLGFDRDFEIRLGIFGSILALSFLVFLYRHALRKHLGKFLLILTVVFSFFGMIDLGFWYGLHEWLGNLFGVNPLKVVRVIAYVDTATASPFVYLYSLVSFILLSQYADDVGTATWFTIYAVLLNLGINANNLTTGYLNSIFTVTRAEYSSTGELIKPGNYEQLGSILWTSWSLSLLLPVFIIIFLLTPWRESCNPIAYSVWTKFKKCFL